MSNSIVFTLPIGSAYELQYLLNSSENVHRRICNAGLEHFEKMWKSLDDSAQRRLLEDIRAVCEVCWELRHARVTVEATIRD